MEGSRLRSLLKDLIIETIQEMNNQNSDSPPEQGTVTAVNDDGTVAVQTTNNFYPNIGAAVVFTIGAFVVVVTGEGRRVAIPR